MENPEPIRVMPGDPVIQLPITNLKGNSLTLEDVANNTFCVFLSTACPTCQDALSNILAGYLKQHHVVLIFRDGIQAVTKFLESYPEATALEIYVTKPSALERYNITNFPALLSYHEGHLAIGFHGPLDQNNTQTVLSYYARHLRSHPGGK